VAVVVVVIVVIVFVVNGVVFDVCTQVSWMRKRDLHILTAGVLTYTSDQRFQVIHPDNSDNWTLLIKFAQPRDAGIYECQINTEPKMSLAFQLNVVGKSYSITYYGKLQQTVFRLYININRRARQNIIYLEKKLRCGNRQNAKNNNTIRMCMGRCVKRFATQAIHRKF